MDQREHHPGWWSPLSVTLVIGVNSSVLWTDNDVAPHTVIIHPGAATSSSGGSTANTVADSGNMNTGAALPTPSPQRGPTP